jgi:hypothetical protein
MESPFEKNGPADERVSPVPDAGLDGQIEVVGFVDQAAHFVSHGPAR